MRTAKFILFSLFLVMFMLSPALAEGWCYQEFANISTECGGLDTGTYAITGAGWNCDGQPNGYCLIDGNWSTWGYALPDGVEDTVVINYTKPDNANTSSLWLTYDDAWGILNRTIPSECWDADEDWLLFRVYYSFHDSYFWHKWECYNGTGYLNLSSEEHDNPIYEEAMWWDIGTTTTTTTSTTTTLYAPPQTPMSNAVRSIVFAFIIMFSAGALLYTMKRKDLNTEQMLEASIAIVIGCVIALMLFGAW